MAVRVSRGYIFGRYASVVFVARRLLPIRRFKPTLRLLKGRLGSRHLYCRLVIGSLFLKLRITIHGKQTISESDSSDRSTGSGS